MPSLNRLASVALDQIALNGKPVIHCILCVKNRCDGARFANGIKYREQFIAMRNKQTSASRRRDEDRHNFHTMRRASRRDVPRSRWAHRPHVGREARPG